MVSGGWTHQLDVSGAGRLWAHTDGPTPLEIFRKLRNLNDKLSESRVADSLFAPGFD